MISSKRLFAFALALGVILATTLSAQARIISEGENHWSGSFLAKEATCNVKAQSDGLGYNTFEAIYHVHGRYSPIVIGCQRDSLWGINRNYQCSVTSFDQKYYRFQTPKFVFHLVPGTHHAQNLICDELIYMTGIEPILE